MQTHRGKKQKAADANIPDPTLHTSTNLYLRIVLTRLKQERELGPFQHLGLRGRSILWSLKTQFDTFPSRCPNALTRGTAPAEGRGSDPRLPRAPLRGGGSATRSLHNRVVAGSQGGRDAELRQVMGWRPAQGAAARGGGREAGGGGRSQLQV